MTKIRVSEFRKNPSVDSYLEGEEKKVSEAHLAAKSVGMSTLEGSDASNEHFLKKAFLAVHQAEYSAREMKISQPAEEQETIKAVKALSEDISQLRDNYFALNFAKAELPVENSQTKEADSIPANHPQPGDNKGKGSLIDDYANFDENMPDYGGGDD